MYENKNVQVHNCLQASGRFIECNRFNLHWLAAAFIGSLNCINLTIQFFNYITDVVHSRKFSRLHVATKMYCLSMLSTLCTVQLSYSVLNGIQALSCADTQIKYFPKTALHHSNIIQSKLHCIWLMLHCRFATIYCMIAAISLTVNRVHLLTFSLILLHQLGITRNYVLKIKLYDSR